MAERQRLPYIDLMNFAGLYTKGSNESLQDTQLTVATNCDFFREYGSLSKPYGSSRVLAAVYSESSVVKPISWVGFYKAADLNGQTLRHTLIASGTKLSKIESDGTLTSLTGSGLPVTESRTSGLFHASAKFGDFLFITNQDPDLVGNGDTLVKYNGAEILRWGLIAPGSTETTSETFSSISGWTAITGGTYSVDTVTTQDGDSLKITGITGTAVLEKTVTIFNINPTVDDARMKVFVYIPRAQMQNVAQTNAIVVRVGSDSLNYWEFPFNIGVLLEGWNELSLDIDADTTTTTGSPASSSLTYFRIAIAARSGQTLDGIRVDKFAYLDAGRPTLAEGSAGSVFSNAAEYQYVVTFVSKTGHESNAGPASDVLTLTQAGANISLTEIPVSTDPQVIARKIYRTVNGGSVFVFVDTIEDNTTTTYSDTTSDTALGNTQPPFAGDISDDNSPPPQGGIVKVWQRTVFMAGVPDNPNSVYFSEDDDGESFPLVNIVTLDDKVTGMYESYSGLVVETETGKWQVTGSNPDFRFDKVINQIGCVGRRASGETRIQGWSIDRDGMRLYDLNNPVKISEVIRDKFDEEFSSVNIELIHSGHSKKHNTILMFVPDDDGAYTSNNYLYQYPLDDITKGWWSQLSLPSSVDVQHIAEIEDSNGAHQLYAAADDGMVYKLFDSASKNWATSDSSSAITTTWTTKWYRLGELGAESEGATGRVMPRFVEVKHVGDNATWTVTVETANGPDQATAVDSKTVTVVFDDNETMMRYPIKRMQAGEYVRLSFTNAQANVTSRISGVRLYFKVFPGQFPLETGDLNSSV